jgi:hypothetical protein
MKWIKGIHPDSTTYWYVVGIVKRMKYECIIEINNYTFGWVYSDICDRASTSLYSFVDDIDVPEARRKEVLEFMTDPFYEIELERYKSKFSD